MSELKSADAYVYSSHGIWELTYRLISACIAPRTGHTASEYELTTDGRPSMESIAILGGHARSDGGDLYTFFFKVRLKISRLGSIRMMRFDYE